MRDERERKYEALDKEEEEGEGDGFGILMSWQRMAYVGKNLILYSTAIC